MAGIDSVLSSISEIKLYYYSVLDNKTNVTVELVKKENRERDSFEIEKEILEKLAYLRSY
jgi:hypothetical protein